MNIVPVIDFSAYRLDRDEPDPDRFQAVIDDIHSALTTVGCMYLKHHGLPIEMINRCFKVSKTFFQMPTEDKVACTWDPKTFSGYRGMMEEGLHVESKLKDIKQTFNLNRDIPNQPLPDEKLPEFRQALEEFFDSCIPFHNRLLEVLARGLKLEDPQYFAKHHQLLGKSGNPWASLRTAHYPSLMDIKITDGEIRCGAHQDLSSITLLFQDSPGLEIMHDGRYIPVPPKEGTAVMLIGETMEKWTAGKYKAAYHRVNLPDRTDFQQPRQSIIFFGNPDMGSPIVPISESENYPRIDRYDIYVNNLIAKYANV